MSWNDKMPFNAALRHLKRQAEHSRQDRPATVARTGIHMAHSVFQPRMFREDLHKDEAHVRELERALRAKPQGQRVLDPILVTAIGPDFYCIDGHHRLLAYGRVGVDGEIPVEHFEGSINDAIKEAIHRNAKDRLAMTHDDKLEAAWKLVCLGGFTKPQIAEASGVGTSTVANMRNALSDLKENKRWNLNMTWRDAKRALQGDEWQALTEEQIAAQTREYARRLVKTFGRKAFAQVEIFADALELASKKLPRGLVEHWSDIAEEVTDANREEREDEEEDFSPSTSASFSEPQELQDEPPF